MVFLLFWYNSTENNPHNNALYGSGITLCIIWLFVFVVQLTIWSFAIHWSGEIKVFTNHDTGATNKKNVDQVHSKFYFSQSIFTSDSWRETYCSILNIIGKIFWMTWKSQKVLLNIKGKWVWQNVSYISVILSL